jgi:signal transduction histidine kinase
VKASGIPSQDQVEVPLHQGMLVISLLALLLVGCAIVMALQQPAFDVRFHVDKDRMIVTQGHELASASSISQDIVSIDGMPAHPHLLLREPDHLATYADYNRFFEQQRQLQGALEDGSLTLLSADGEPLMVSVRKRHLSDLPAGFWVQLMAGSLALLISGGVWSYRRHLPSARAFVVCGLGFAMVCSSLAVYSLRELVMDAQVFLFLQQLNRLAVTVLTLSGVVLFWYYPQRLARFPVTGGLAALGVMLWCNETFQWWEWPMHAFQAPFFISPVLALLVGVAQWRKSARQPLERAALRWLLLSFLIFFTGILLLYVMPNIFLPEASLNLEIASLIVLSIFGGVALGITRYRLFDLERWWLEAWLWFLGGLLVVVVDIIIVGALDLGFSSSLTLTVLLVGWVYFPIRQWILRRVAGHYKTTLDTLLPPVFRFMLRQHDSTEQAEFWRQILNHAFQPLHHTLEHYPSERPRIDDHGLMLCVPDISGQQTMELAGCQRGQKLFNKDDLELVSQLLALIRYADEQYQKQKEATMRERERIMRDLHDEVSAKLLTLIHRSSDENADVARAALSSLRDTIYSLQPHTERNANELFDDLRCEFRERCEAAGIALQWTCRIEESISLSAHQQINASRIMREALTNALKHACASTIAVSIQHASDWIRVDMQDDGVGRQVDARNGNGMLNMQRRSRELAGQLTFSPVVPQGTRVEFQFPVEINNEDHFRA